MLEQKIKQLEHLNRLGNIDKLVKDLHLASLKTEYENIVNEAYDDLVESYDAFPYDASWELKKTIVIYLSGIDYSPEVIDDTRLTNPEIDKKIADALSVLEEYKTPEYFCLRNNGFYNPFVKRESFTKTTPRSYHASRNNEFYNELIEHGLSTRKADAIKQALEEIWTSLD